MRKGTEQNIFRTANTIDYSDMQHMQASGTPENGMCRYFIGNGT